jgi:hypothetical protein
MSAEPKYHGQAAGRAAAMAKSGPRAVPWAEIWSEASACRTRSRDGPESAALGTARGDPRSAGLGAVGCRSPSEHEGELGPRRPTVPGPPGPSACDINTLSTRRAGPESGNPRSESQPSHCDFDLGGRPDGRALMFMPSPPLRNSLASLDSRLKVPVRRPPGRPAG